MRCLERACEQIVQCQKTDRCRRCGRRRAGAQSWQRRQRPPAPDQWQRCHAQRRLLRWCVARRCRRPDTICRSCAPFSAVRIVLYRLLLYIIIVIRIVFIIIIIPSPFLYVFYFFNCPPARPLTPYLRTHTHARNINILTNVVMPIFTRICVSV